MLGLSQKLSRSLAALFGLALAVPPALAQDAPVYGAHYAPNSGAGAGGDYATSVPLDLPKVKGGLPLPLQIVHGGNRFGAAGLRWEIPISSIRRDVTIAHRRPINAPGPLQPREQLSLSLFGSSFTLVMKPEDHTTWLALRGGQQLEAHDVGGGVFELYDGYGLKYVFSSDGGSTGALDNGNLYVLRDIFGPGAAKVHLDYGFSAPSLGGGSTGLTISLASVSYNYNADGTCPKHIVNLNYGPLSAAPLSISVLGSTALVRMQVLRGVQDGTAIDVMARDNAPDQPVDCDHTTMKSLRSYNFTYRNDPDTRQLQLSQVTMIGQEGSDERAVTLPVATYEYGQFIGSDGKLNYRDAKVIDLPSDVTSTGGITGTASTGLGPNGTLNIGLKSLLDINGKGQPDVLYDFTSRRARNLVGPDGTTVFVAADPLPTFITGVRSENLVTNEDGKRTIHNTVMSQLIDMNGDGRLDFVTANELPDAWVVYLNTPDTANPDTIIWQRRVISFWGIAQHLIDAGLLSGITDLTQVSHLPLSRSVSIKTIHLNTCWKRTATDWVHTLDGYDPQRIPPPCTLPQGDDPLHNPPHVNESFYGYSEDPGEQTFVEWRLQDINHDGFPDFLYNGSPVTGQLQEIKPTDSASVGTILPGFSNWSPQFAGSSAVNALINRAGVQFSESTPGELFTSGSQLVPDAGPLGCGVEKWEPHSIIGSLRNTCGFVDVNGDGIVDRVSTVVVRPEGFPPHLPHLETTANLGTGDPANFLSELFIFLPGPLAVNQRQLERFDGLLISFYRAPDSVCADLTSTYPVQTLAALRDINGDGFPDYVVGHNTQSGVPGAATWTVQFGTGTGFSAPVTIDGSFDLSVERVTCSSRTSAGAQANITSGLWDLDGDGQLDLLLLNSPNQISVLKNQGKSAAASAAGRLKTIGNGYGAVTNIAYRSAKEDATTLHMIPSSEVMVASVSTTDAFNNPLVQPVLYAYGNIGPQYFDAANDRWVSSGYQRKVSLQNTGDPNDPGAGNATISDSYALAPFKPATDATDRFLRYMKAGRVSDITTLSGSTSEGSGDLGTDPWALLTVDVTRDARRVAASHMDYRARLLPGESNDVLPNNPIFCVDMVKPYDYGFSLNYAITTDSHDQCAARGFALQTSVTSYRSHFFMNEVGTADVITSPSIVKSGSVITGFNDFGQVTDSINNGDLADPSTSLCVHVDYASPVSSTGVRVLNAVAQQIVKAQTAGQDCNGATLTKTRFEYDGLTASAGNPVGQVSDGFVTSSTVTRYDENHAPLGDIRLFDATYNADGTLQSTTKTRDEDNARNGTNFSYDPFGLVLTRQDNWSTGTNFDTLFTVFTPDPVTLNITSTTDTNGTVRGATYDGFGRILQSKITPPGGVEGILSSNAYFGFELNALQQRSITQKVFTDAATDVSAPSRDSEVAFDILGRPTGTFVHLGADYQFRTVIVGARTYDALGRVKFMADPMLSNDDISTAYGTSYNYNTNGTPTCFVRGTGVKPAFASLNETNEVYPTCFEHFFDNNKEVLRRHDPDSGGAVNKDTTLNALGRVLQSRAFTSATHGQPEVDFKRAVFGYDALGHMTSMTRYQDATNQTGAVTTTWHYDSLGWMTKLEEPGVAAQTRSFDNWGEITQVQWCEDLSAAPCPGQDRSSITQYDAIGRVTHREDQVGGQTVPGTVNDYTYDVGVENTTPPVTATNTLGRLASASWPTGAASFSYDGFGRMNAKVFTDTSVTPNKVYVETHEIHDDGSEKTLHLLLPDNGFTDEKVDYDYDTAGRIKSALYNDGATPPTTQSLFAASGSTPIYDIFGRINNAKYGLTSFNATFAAAGRRLLTDVKVTSGDQAHSREIAFPTLNGVTPYDPQGRETQRREFTDGAAPTALLRSYDPIGQLSAAQNLQVATNTTQADRAFTYDPLGNILFQTDSGTPQIGSVGLTYDAADLDRVCGIAYEGAPLPIHCNVTYDGAGDITSMPTRSGTPHSFTYFPSGHVSGIASGGSLASFAYDAFGALQQLTLNTPQTDMRADKYFGALLKQRIEGSNSVLTRKIPAPGLVATRHGPTGGWTFAFGEPRGTRFVTDQAGAFVQDIDYAPFGEAGGTGATPGTTNYTSEQWNGGDLLQAFGVVNLGARLYDPVIGRFLSRDPIIGKNPYAFADNDPINKSDPTGLDPVETPQPLPILNPFGGGSAGGPAANASTNRDQGLYRPREWADTNWPEYGFRAAPGDGYEWVEGEGLVNTGDPNQKFVNPFGPGGTAEHPRPRGTVCNKSCHAGSDGGHDPNVPVIDGGPFVEALESTAVTLATIPWARIGFVLRGIGATSIDIVPGATLLGKGARWENAGANAWQGLVEPTRNCVALTCARSIRGLGRAVTGDEVLANAGITGEKLRLWDGVLNHKLRDVFLANGKDLGPELFGRPTVSGDYAVSIGSHMMYGRVTSAGRFFIDDVQANIRIRDADQWFTTIWSGARYQTITPRLLP